MTPIGHTLPQLAFDPANVDPAEALGGIETRQFSTEMGAPMLAVTQRLRQRLHIARYRNRRDELGLFGLQLPNLVTEQRTPSLDRLIVRPQLRERVRDRAIHDFWIEHVIGHLGQDGIVSERHRKTQAVAAYALASIVERRTDIEESLADPVSPTANGHGAAATGAFQQPTKKVLRSHAGWRPPVSISVAGLEIGLLRRTQSSMRG